MRSGRGLRRTLLVATALGLAMALLASGLTLALSAVPGVSPGFATAAAYALGLAVVLSYATYRLGTLRLPLSLDPEVLPRERFPAVYDTFDRLAADLGVESPQLLVADVGAPNALSFGGRRGGYVVVDPRLLRLLDGAELEGVLAHELAHLRSRDSVVQSMAYSLVQTVGTLVYLLVLPFVAAVLLTRGLVGILLGRPRRSLRHDVVATHYRTLQATVVVLLVLTVVTRSFSRQREYAADDRAVAATGRPLALARALRKIDRAATTPGELLAQLTIRGDEEGRLTRLLATHPPMDERVERLRRRAAEERSGDAVRVEIR